MKMVILDGGVLNPGDVSWKPLEALGELAVYDDTCKEDIARRVTGAEIVMVNKVRLGAGDLPALQDCRLIGVLATGTNNIDLFAMKGAGIPVCNVTAYGVADVAQHALALLLEICNNVGQESRAVRLGEWQKRGEWCYWLKTPIALSGLTMGIIGFGAIGQATGKLANALGMSVLALSRARGHTPAWRPFAYATEEEIFANSDVISLHCPLTPQTDKIINAKNIAMMKRGAIIINTARGGLVDEVAAAKALKSGQLGALGTDVLSAEPPDADNPLPHAPNTFITPHMAWASASARQRIIDIMAANIQSLETGNLKNRVA